MARSGIGPAEQVDVRPCARGGAYACDQPVVRLVVQPTASSAQRLVMQFMIRPRAAGEDVALRPLPERGPLMRLGLSFACGFVVRWPLVRADAWCWSCRPGITLIRSESWRGSSLVRSRQRYQSDSRERQQREAPDRPQPP